MFATAGKFKFDSPAAKGEAETMREKILMIAAVCHAANREYCKTIGDHSIPSWDLAPSWQRESAIAGVEMHVANLAAGAKTAPSASHESWLAKKRADGWKFGPTKDAGLKTHPCFVPFEQLPPEQKVKDYIFGAIVEAFWNASQQESGPAPEARSMTGEVNPEPVAAG